MANSPSKHAPHPSANASASTTHVLSSPRSTRTLRKLQSAHALSTSYATLNTPSLISQQRQQQQQQQLHIGVSHNNTSPPVPPLPPSNSHHRTRSNSDALAPSPSHLGIALVKRSVPSRKIVVHLTPTEELETLVRQGPRGDVPTGLQRLRHLILCDGLDADSDGMVGLRWPWHVNSSSVDLILL